jgi:hypothetical protein
MDLEGVRVSVVVLVVPRDDETGADEQEKQAEEQNKDDIHRVMFLAKMIRRTKIPPPKKPRVKPMQ